MNAIRNLNLKEFFLLLMLLTALLILLTSCSEELVSETHRDYSMNSQTILTSLAQGADYTDVFIPETRRGVISPLFGRTQTHWHIDKYFVVAQAIHQHIWGESLGNGWKLHSQLVGFGCKTLGEGPTDVFFEYFKNKDGTRLVSRLDIRSTGNLIKTTQLEYRPQISEWEYVELAEIISAEDAVMIAEKNGGSDIRTQLNNACGLSLKIVTGNNNDHYWRIWYQSYEGTGGTVAKYWINALTGAVEFVDRD